MNIILSPARHSPGGLLFLSHTIGFLNLKIPHRISTNIKKLYYAQYCEAVIITLTTSFQIWKKTDILKSSLHPLSWGNTIFNGNTNRYCCIINPSGGVAEWLGSGLQIHLHRFKSGHHLQFTLAKFNSKMVQ